MVSPTQSVHIGTTSHSSVGNGGAWIHGPNSYTWPTANRAFFIPFRISTPIVVRSMWLLTGTVASGSFDLGIYDKVGTKLVSTGSTNEVGTSLVQFVELDDTLLGSGQFYFACVFDGTVGTIKAGAIGGMLLGMAFQDSAFPLPGTATFSSTRDAVGFQPMIGLSGIIQ